MIKINLSQSAFSYNGCILEIARTVIGGYYSTPSSNIVYGEAIHKYRHIMFQTSGHIPTAREEAIKTFNQSKNGASKSSRHMDDQNHMLTTAFNYWEMGVKEDKDTEYILLNDKPATEVTFSIPYYKDEHIEVNLCGTLDGLAKIKGGCCVIVDLKTTSAWDKDNFFTGFQLSRQLRFYAMALTIMSEKYPESILGQIGATNVGARVDGLFIKPSPNENVYRSSEVFQYKKEEIAAFRLLVDDKIQDLSRAVAKNYFPKQGILNNSCIGKWGMCQYGNVCAANNKDVEEILLKRDFKQKTFTPLNYSGL
jgi:hypothetical protein